MPRSFTSLDVNGTELRDVALVVFGIFHIDVSSFPSLEAIGDALRLFTLAVHEKKRIEVRFFSCSSMQTAAYCAVHL